MVSIGIIGGSGYTGKHLLKFCSAHPFIDEIKVYGHSTAGEKLSRIFPELSGMIEDKVVCSSADLSFEHDLYFIALPHGEALNIVPQLFKARKKIIDLGGDYRLNNADEYQKWYGIDHKSSSLLQKKLYGLADLNSIKYNSINLIANPGCYPTAALLSLLPMVEEIGEIINTISISAYSGTSGAGKSPKSELMMSEMFGNVAAYNVNRHRHSPEILQQLKTAGFNSSFSFTTHLLPLAVGIYSTSIVHLNESISQEKIDTIYSSFYADSFFIRLRDTPPNLNWVVNSNFCDINVSTNGNAIIITAAIDNLIKGASGQAIQNLNKLFGWDEFLGIVEKGEKNVSVY